MDIKGQCLIYPSGFTSIILCSTVVTATHLGSITLRSTVVTATHLGSIASADNKFTKLLAMSQHPHLPTLFPSIGCSSSPHKLATLHARACRLPPDKLRLAKEEFRKMEELGIIRRSDSHWSSPPNHQVVGDHVETSDATQCHTYRTSCPTRVRRSSQRLILFMATTRSLCYRRYPQDIRHHPIWFVGVPPQAFCP